MRNRSENLFDHYSVASQKLIKALKRRNIDLLWCYILEFCSTFFVIQPTLSMSVFLQDWIKGSSTEMVLINNILQTLFWILLAYKLKKYVNDTYVIDRLFAYRRVLEKKADAFSRHLLHAQSRDKHIRFHTNHRRIMDIFHKVYYPCVFLAINIYKIILDCTVFSTLTIIDSIVFIRITLILLIFWADMYPKINDWCRKLMPGFVKYVRQIRKFLKVGRLRT